MLRNCDTQHYMENKGRMVRLAEYSRNCLKLLRETTAIQYKNTTRDIVVLQEAGVPYQLLESARLAEVETALGRSSAQTDWRFSAAK